MKAIYKHLSFSILVVVCIACNEESDLAISRVVAPVVVDVADSNVDEITATFSELDKSGILDHTVGVVKIAVPDLVVEVFVAGTSVGTFTTDASGNVVVGYSGTKPNEYAGTYKGVAFRIKK